MTSSLILLQYSLYSSLTSVARSNSLPSSCICSALALSSPLRMLRGDFSSSFLSYSTSTRRRALSMRSLASSMSICAFSFIRAVLSSLCLRRRVSASWSLMRHSLETSVILLCSSCSSSMIFCSRLASSPSLARSLPSSRTSPPSIFLNCFSFSRSLFLCCSDRLVQNSISFCFSVSLAFASSAFFHVYNSHTTFRYSSFSPPLYMACLAPLSAAPYAGPCGERSSGCSRSSLTLKPRYWSCWAGPRSYRQTMTLRLPTVLTAAPS